MNKLLTLAILLLCGCASMTPQEKTYLVSSIADVSTTYYRMEQGAIEINPIMTMAGDDIGEVIASATVLKFIGYKIVKMVCKGNKPCENKALLFGAGFNFSAAGWNMSHAEH